jgi:LCP family protein required for cell wall assembly
MKYRLLIFITCTILSLLLFADGLSVLADMADMERKILQNRSDKKQTQEESTSKSTSKSTSNNEETQNKETITEEYINLLVLGLDEEELRSDVILLLNYSLDSGKLNILSIPRDTKVNIKGKPAKINALYAIGGEPLVNDRIKKITGLSADYYIILNFKGFRKIIDTLGGVEFDVPINMNYDDPVQNLHIHLKKGKQILDGKKSEGLVRYRKGNDEKEGYEDGDIGRIKVQQEFLKEIIKQKLKLKYISKADEIFNVLKEYMKTNIQIRDIKYYLKGIRNFKYDQIKGYTIPGQSVYQNKVWYFLHDSKKTQKIIDENFYR